MAAFRGVIAIVDDDPRLLESVGDLMESAGYIAITFPSADALISRGFSGIDVVITDIGMPGTDGLELRDLVMAARPELPVLLVTGRHETTEQNRARGISGFFRKPFDAQALLSAVGEALSNQAGRNPHEN